MCVGGVQYSVPVQPPRGLEPNPDEKWKWKWAGLSGNSKGGLNILHPVFFLPSLKNEGADSGHGGHGALGTTLYLVVSSARRGGRFHMSRLAIGVRVCPVVCLSCGMIVFCVPLCPRKRPHSLWAAIAVITLQVPQRLGHATHRE